MKTVLSVAAGIAGVLFVLAVSAAADKPPAAGAKPASAAPAATAAPAAAAGPGAMAMPTAPVAPPKPGPEHESLKKMVGVWKCSGKSESSPMGPAHAVEATMTIKTIMGGLFTEGTYKEKKTKENPFPTEGRATWGYDSMGKMYTSAWISSWGESMVETSKGMEPPGPPAAGSKMVWVSEGMMGPGSKWTETQVFASDKEFALTMEMTMSGKTMPAGSFTCKK